MLNFLRQEGVSETIIKEIEDFRAKWPTAGSPSRRITSPRYLYYGKDIWGWCRHSPAVRRKPALVGPRAMGKAENGVAQ